MESPPGRPVANRLAGLEEAQVGRRPGRLGPELTASHLLMAIGKQPDERRSDVERVTARAKTPELDPSVALGPLHGGSEE